MSRRKIKHRTPITLSIDMKTKERAFDLVDEGYFKSVTAMFEHFVRNYDSILLESQRIADKSEPTVTLGDHVAAQLFLDDEHLFHDFYWRQPVGAKYPQLFEMDSDFTPIKPTPLHKEIFDGIRQGVNRLFELYTIERRPIKSKEVDYE